MKYRVLSKMLGILSIAMAVPLVMALGIAIWYREDNIPLTWGGTLAVTLVCGLFLLWLGKGKMVDIYEREGLALVTLGWLLAAFYGSLPFLFARVATPAAAYFESMSGFTTTGASVFGNVEALPHSLLFWRAMTHWLGGLGIVVILLAVLPWFGSGGKQLYRSEVPGLDKGGLRPRIHDTAIALLKIYLGLTVAQTCLLVLARMSLFDAVTHTFATLATGGFSTKNGSVGDFHNLSAEIIITVFMAMAGVNFGVYYAMTRGDWSAPIRNSEVKAYLLLLVVSTLLISINLVGFQYPAVHGHVPAQTSSDAAGISNAPSGASRAAPSPDWPHLAFFDALRKSAFQVVSITTTTGFSTDDFDQWPYFSRALLVALMFIGACSGSTGGGTKVIRIIILFRVILLYLERMFRPKTIRVVRINGEPVSPEILHVVPVFFSLHIAIVIVGTLFMSFLGLPLQSALTSVVACVNNIGPGLELVGPMNNYSEIPGIGQAFLSLLMLMGRLEFFSVCVLLFPSFWRRG
ncbi:MAG TPA: TrkH family potassium uptake protein [Candidatus Hydrogenedentes bacterium]|nr:TrkH family potassium uptake protein [Candidatus Hydrogenedentota bacterium]HOK89652.1 TrkH family potassium uptake protein [Candidatus Hydrogenedentota bacterium]HPO30295.1 TrkH family potassium uptake protein [Candidatus Hydrogenedentota bacterium]